MEKKADTGLTVQEMMEYQLRLQEKYAGVWEGDNPGTAKHHLLYAVEEIGEVSAILKKRGALEVTRDAALRAHLCEEMADVFMYLNDVLLCCGVTAEEFASAYHEKMERNLQRDFPKEHQAYLKSEGN